MNATRTGVMFAVFLIMGVPLSAHPQCNSTTFVTVLDEATGEPVDTFSAHDFRAELNGSRLPIRSLTAPPRNRRFVFVLDRSGSMTGTSDDHLPQEYDPGVLAPLVLKDAISAIPKNDLEAFQEFAGEHSEQREFVGSDAALRELPDLLAWSPIRKHKNGGGNTPLWNNVDAAFRMFGPHRPGDVVVVISDGGDNQSRLREGQVRSELVSAGVPVLAFVLVHFPGPTEVSEGVRALLDLANSTGGAGTVRGVIPQGEDFGSTLPVRPGQAISLLSHQYGLQLDTPALRKAEKWRLTLGPSYSSRKLRLLFPRYLPPCQPVAR